MKLNLAFEFGMW